MTAPGLTMLSGSRSCLTCFGQLGDLGAELGGKQRAFLRRPTPCSLVIVPPSEMASSMISVNASAARSFAASSVASKTMVGCVLPSLACATTGIATCRAAETPGSRRAVPAAKVPGVPTSSSINAPRPSSAGKNAQPRLDEHLALVGVVGAEALGRAVLRARCIGDRDLGGAGRAGASDWMTSSAPAARVFTVNPELLDAFHSHQGCISKLFIISKALEYFKLAVTARARSVAASFSVGMITDTLFGSLNLAFTFEPHITSTIKPN